MKVFDQYKEEIEEADTIRFIYGKYWLPSSELILTKDDENNTAYIIGHWVTYNLKSNIAYWRIDKISYEKNNENLINKGSIKIKYKWEWSYRLYNMNINNDICYISEREPNL